MARKIYETVAFRVVLPAGTGAADLVTGFVPGYRGKIKSWQYVADTAATGAGATRDFNLEIGTTDVTGSATTIALADVDTVGERKAGSAITAANEFDDDDAISIEVAAGGTAFTAGAGTFYLLLEQSARGI